MQILRMQSLAMRLIGISTAAVAATALCGWLLQRWLPVGPSMAVAAAAGALLAAAMIWRTMVPLRALFRALAGTVASFRDGDFSFGISWDKYSDVIELVDAHNALGTTLREQRLALVQRELLLDTMVQNTPVAMVLLDPAQRVVHANIAARKLFLDGRKLEGHHLDELVNSAPDALREALDRGGDGMFTVGRDDDEDIFHLARRRFRLNGRNHDLLLLRQLTAELRRQEVQTWKKVIRVISHELNNSLAPIASLAHSGSLLLQRGQLDKLPTALTTIEERARHLEGFIRDYARFAKLPAPRLQNIHWNDFLAKLHSQVQFGRADDIPGLLRADQAQVEQALLNLIRNAHESGSAAEDVQVQVRQFPDYWRIDVLDRGSGMNEAVLAQALLPFYSTKRHGTGLGLALAREIAEAHGGRIALLNREGGGLCVSIILPT